MPQPPIRAKRNSTRPDEFLNAIPNRDLTDEDWDRLDGDQRDLVRKSGLYDVPTEAQFKAKVTEKEKPKRAEPKAKAEQKDEPKDEPINSPSTDEPAETKEVNP